MAKKSISGVVAAAPVAGMVIEWWPIDRLIPYPKNARKWSKSAIEKVAASIREFGWVHLGLTGFGAPEIEGMVGKTQNPEEDDVPPVPVAPVTKLGDLWLLGEHRVLCGDSTDENAVSRLMSAEKAGLMNTDPPYGVSYSNSERPNPGVAKDELRDEELQRFLERAFSASAELALRPNAAWYLWHAHLTQGYFAAAAAAAHVILHRQIIWVKPVLLLGRGQYHWKHEPCFMGWVEGNQPPDYGCGDGERTQTTVWEIGSVTQAERKEFNHSTPKPVELFRIPLIKHLKVGEIAYDPFAGSGPQVIAAETEGRRCFAMEIEPAFVDVIILRWEKLTGKKAMLEGHDGLTFDNVRNGRRLQAEDALKEEAVEACA